MKPTGRRGLWSLSPRTETPGSRLHLHEQSLASGLASAPTHSPGALDQSFSFCQMRKLRHAVREDNMTLYPNKG